LGQPTDARGPAGPDRPVIQTDCLVLFPLTLAQLEHYLDEPERLEQDLGHPISRSIVTERLRRAIEMKLAKMRAAEQADLVWLTYWLLVVSHDQFGAGLIGFKGTPADGGEVEIGYGIDSAYQGQGYMTEAVRAMIDWAFRHQACRTVVAPGTLKDNIASNRVLAKVGMEVYEETDEALSWRIGRDAHRPSGGRTPAAAG
jgi:ribosomal-protein-alanine N-acetyltransferase